MTRAIAQQMESDLTRRTIQPRTLATDPNYDKPISELKIPLVWRGDY
jgi:hypothetical protein